MTTDSAHTIDIVARDLDLINALGGAAENLAIRSTAEDISAAERAALRNKAKTANEQAGALLTRGTVELFSDPPDDAVKRINEALAKTQEVLDGIQKAKKAIEFVGALVAVAGSVLTGDWKAILKSLETLAKKMDDETAKVK
jgi:formate-dependent phosphoribosylglycinamide formyltransferase (GAR transformylase)